MQEQIYDVIICGSGLAGLTLARQLKLTMPNLSILTIDKLSRSLPEASFKVGESSVEVGAYYLAHSVQLEDYLEKNHFPKLGLRYFFGDSQQDFHQRSEFGLSEFHQPNSYQMDRGILENDLRQMNVEAGITLLENCQIKGINLAENTEKLHEVEYKDHSNQVIGIAKSRWVIDAMGRRRFLQKKLGLNQPNSDLFNAVWFRVEGKFDITDFVPSEQKQWHNRVPGAKRYYSTNHLCGNGYWVWLIPLSSGHTSIGIVAHQEMQPFSDFNTYKKAYQWLLQNEPSVAQLLSGKQPKDFMKMPKYSYTTSQVFSIDRWACTGEAGIFPDPFYSPGTDMIGFSNSLITQMIEADYQSQLNKEMVDRANSFFLAYHKSVKSSIQNMYYCFGNELAGATKIIWDTMAAWAYSGPLMFNGIFLDHQKRNRIFKGSGKFFLLTTRVQKLFRDWSEKSLNKGHFEFIDYLEVLPFMAELRDRNLRSNQSEENLIDQQIKNLEFFEEYAQVIFLLAVADTMPEQLERVTAYGWVNAWAISLEADKWEQDQLFCPKSQPRDLTPIIESLQQVFQFSEPVFEMALKGNALACKSCKQPLRLGDMDKIENRDFPNFSIAIGEMVAQNIS
jgi:flavin-dependent dehydrogenase